ncbi:hypothetical protein FRB94_013093 [Tulasnella sp. JGI-2019a]|nr:hypothetical protein FRB94_013093 [Tulasnella sp. JGI-2019a]KAG8997655.1 hypothetical protein FRB93_014015 [Tulasnella sp. JGI-2019a]KAG9023590.1 hypothetical protein FRB95_012734 [Tulasnella sp. JGI-2019a]
MSGNFIVVFKDSATDEQIEQYVNQVNNTGGLVTQKYDLGMRGFAANLDEAQLQSFQGNEIIKYVEADGPVKASSLA